VVYITKSRPTLLLADSSPKSLVRVELSCINHNTDTDYIFVEHGISLFGHSRGNEKVLRYAYSRYHSCFRWLLYPVALSTFHVAPTG